MPDDEPQLIDDVELIDIEELSPHPNNPKNHPDEQIGKIAASIAEYGWDQPIVIDKDNVIIKGHGRLQAAKKLGLDKVPVIKREDLSKAQARGSRIADNKTAESSWDDELLATEIEQLMDEDDTLPTGMDDDEIDDLLAEIDKEETVEEDNPDIDAPQDSDEATTEEGDIWILGDHRVICGDATNPETYEQLMDGEQAAITITSPPYNAGDNPEAVHGNTHMTESKYKGDHDDRDQDEWVNLVNTTIENCRQHSKYQFFNIQMLANNKVGYTEILHSQRHFLVDVMIWDKDDSAPPAMAEDVLTSNYENIIITRDQQNPTRRIETGPEFHGTINQLFECPPQRNNEYSEHIAATFPIDFPTHFIKNFTHRQDKVLDPFAGSGTTAIAAEQLQRQAHLIEKQPHYVDIIIQRWQQHTGQQAVHAEEEQTFDELTAQRGGEE